MFDKAKCFFLRVHRGVRGFSLLTAVLIVAITLVVLGAAIPVVWPMLQETETDIAALNESAGATAATNFLESMWPIVILIVGLGIVVALIWFGLKRFGLKFGKKGGGL